MKKLGKDILGRDNSILKALVFFCKVERGALGGLLWLLRISEACVGWARSGTEIGRPGPGISLPEVGHNTGTLFCKDWGVKGGGCL